MSSTNSISYTLSQQNIKSQPQASIYGINVKNFGLAVDQAEQTERFEHLLAARDLEEQERSRRVAEDRECELDIEKFRISARKEAGQAQEEERKSRLADLKGEEQRKLLANKLSSAIAQDILTPSLKLRSAAHNVFINAKIFSQDLVASAGDYAYRAASFFGHKKDQTLEKASEMAQNIKGQAYDQAHLLSEKTTGYVQSVKDQALEQAHNLTEKASETAYSLKDQALAQAHHLTEKASETAYNIKDQAYTQAYSLGEKATGTAHLWAEKATEKTHLLARSVSQQAQELGGKAVEQAQSLGEKVINLGTEMLTFTGAFEFLTKASLSVMEETERQWRMSSGLTIERFLNALKVSDMIKATDIYSPDFEPNRWYATSILEEFERNRRFKADNSAAVSNARRAAHIVHLKNIQEQGYHPDAKRIEIVNESLAKKSNAFKTSSMIKNAGIAPHSPLGMAAM